MDALALNPILQRFAERTPIPVMLRALLERCLCPAQLDAWFEAVAEAQYTRALLFSTAFDLMTQVVFRQQPTVHSAYQAGVESIGVSVASVYNKLNGLEPSTSAGLVRFAAEQAQALIGEVGGARPAALSGWRMKILDGNHLAAREHRLKETRRRTAAPLPGEAVVVFDPALEVIVDLVPFEDAYTQERVALSALLERVQAGELWVGDRNFCTVGFLRGLEAHGAAGLLREHEQIRFTPLEPMAEVGRVEGATVAEQRVRLGPADDPTGLVLRRIRVSLDTPTREGETTLYLLTHLPPEAADAGTLAALYRARWTIEKAFLHLTVQLRCEIDTLGYPRAALFGFSIAAVAFNGLAVVKAALRAVHGAAAIDEGVSGYYLAQEMATTAPSLDAVLDPEDWAVFRDLAVAVFAAWLLAQAARANLRKYRKHPRGPKKPPPKPLNDPRQPHVSIARLLAQRTKKSSP